MFFTGPSSGRQSSLVLIPVLVFAFRFRCMRNSVLFFVLFGRGASAGADLVGSFDSRHRVELRVLVHDRLVKIGWALEAPVGIPRHTAFGRVRTLYDVVERCCS